MEVQDVEPIPLEDLYANNIERKALTKTFGIIRSSSAIVSLVSSLIIIWILYKSNGRFSSIYHRMLLGMCIGDAIFSLSQAHFNAAAPRDNDYFVWNAIGTQATCSARGFLSYLGAIMSMFYNVSLNLYSLAAVKYRKTERDIRKNIEPFLHGVPIAWAFIYSTTRLVEKNFNDGGGGNCLSNEYNPQHCKGYSDGEVREGFTIPCGRGGDGAILFSRIALFTQFFTVPFVAGVSLLMIYNSVKQQERANTRYGAGVFMANAANNSSRQQSTSGGTNGNIEEGDGGDDRPSLASRFSISIISAVSTLTNRQSQASRQSLAASNSRLVLHRAFLFTMSYFLTWSFFLVGTGYVIAGEKWPIELRYLSAIFTPLQGFFNLLVFMQPKVVKTKSRGGDDMTWCQAVMEAVWSSLTGRQVKPGGGGQMGRIGKSDRSQTQRMSMDESQPKIQQAPEVEGNDDHVPNIDED